MQRCNLSSHGGFGIKCGRSWQKHKRVCVNNPKNPPGGRKNLPSFLCRNHAINLYNTKKAGGGRARGSSVGLPATHAKKFSKGPGGGENHSPTQAFVCLFVLRVGLPAGLLPWPAPRRPCRKFAGCSGVPSRPLDTIRNNSNTLTGCSREVCHPRPAPAHVIECFLPSGLPAPPGVRENHPVSRQSGLPGLAFSLICPTRGPGFWYGNPKYWILKREYPKIL